MGRRPDLTPEASGSSVEPLAIVAMAGVSLFLLILVAFHFIQPELNPLYRFGSEYARGRMGWLLHVGFFACAVGIGGLAQAFRRGLDAPARSRAGVALLAIGAVGIFSSGVFPSDLLVLRDGRWVFEPSPTPTGIAHDASGFLAFLTMLPAMVLITSRLRGAGRLSGATRWLRILAWLAPVLFLALLFLFGPRGFSGLGQRLFLVVWSGWLLMAANGLRTGVFRAD